MFKKREGKVVLYVPRLVPKRLVPSFATRDYNDMRKVVVVGCNS